MKRAEIEVDKEYLAEVGYTKCRVKVIETGIPIKQSGVARRSGVRVVTLTEIRTFGTDTPAGTEKLIDGRKVIHAWGEADEAQEARRQEIREQQARVKAALEARGMVEGWQADFQVKHTDVVVSLGAVEKLLGEVV